MNRDKKSGILVIAVLLAALAAPAAAQLQTGNLFGTVKTADGTLLPNVTVTLSGGGAPAAQSTNEKGEFRFPGLPPGSYQLLAELDGFIPLEGKDLTINVGRNTTMELTLQPARQGIDETITVVGSPLLDARRISVDETVTLEELESIPTARDPWAVLQSTPGVLTDRINVSGSESGQQAQYVGPGSGGDQAVWSLDGMVMTDMSATGSSPGYYDFEAFEEMQVTTGGSDATTATGGVVLNMVTRRGTNDWRASGRYMIADDSLQSDLSLDESELGQRGPWNNDHPQPEFKQGNRIVEVIDWGLEGGGPIVKDKLWIWGSYAKPEIRLLTINDYSDDTTLESSNLKLTGQVTPSNSLTAFAWDSDKIKLGRGASPLRPQETTWNQSAFGGRPTAWKVEDTQMLGSSFYLTGLYSEANGGFEFVPQGGDKVPYLDADNKWHNSFFVVQTERPQQQLKGDGASYFSTGNLSHELKYGAGYRVAEVTSLSRTPGGGWECCGGILLLARDGFANVEADYTSLYVQDTLAAGSLTANLGLRYDRQGGEIRDTTVRANPVFPELLPEAHFAGQDGGFEWSTIVPRLGLTWGLGKDRKTLLRASYSRYADQLATGIVSFLNPIGAQQYRYFFTDNNGGPSLEPGDIGDEAGQPSGNIDPFTFQPLQSNAIDPELAAPITSEALVGIEHALRPELVVGLQATWRSHTGNLETERLVFDGDAFADENLGHVGRVHRRDDYVERTDSGLLPDGRPYSVSWWELRDGVTTRDGFRLENGDRVQDFLGASLSLTKRLANRWMMRGNVSWQDWTWNIPDSENEDPTDTIAGGIVDGTEVLQGSGVVSGAKGNVFINSAWSYSLNGLYQIAPDRRWGFSVAANLTGREGYPLRYARRIVRDTIVDAAGLGIDVPVVADPDAYRYPDVHILDLRVEKEFSLSDLGLTLGVDVFNALNESYVLQRQGLLTKNNADHVLEIVSPRVFRLGARLSFR
ncbi:MAG TPA: TonB-dependent receptor [Thermoanaerobaculia bacterium]|nr:TonB-dependent receptor [Thermoanaerobaculia bacterium]